MALGVLMIGFIILSVISILGLLLLFLIQTPQRKKGIFIFLGCWGLFIAGLSASSLPSNHLGDRLTAWGIGLLGLAGTILYLKSESKNLRFLAHLLVIAAIAGGILNMFFS